MSFAGVRNPHTVTVWNAAVVTVLNPGVVGVGNQPVMRTFIIPAFVDFTGISLVFGVSYTGPVLVSLGASP